MKKTDAFSKYIKAPFSAVLLSEDARVLSRSDRALTLSKKFRCRSNFTPCLPPDYQERFLACKKNAELALLPVRLEEKKLSALLIPVEYEERPCYLLILLEKEELSATTPYLSRILCKAFYDDSLLQNEAGEEFLADTLRRSFALSLATKQQPEIFTLKHGCMLLNRFSQNGLKAHGLFIEAFCTDDCAEFPFPDFPRMGALLLGICLFLLLGSGSQRLKVLFFVEKEHLCVQILLKTESALDGSLFDGSIFEKALLALNWERAQTVYLDGTLRLILRSKKALPGKHFASDQTEQQALALLQLLLEKLLSR